MVTQSIFKSTAESLKSPNGELLFATNQEMYAGKTKTAAAPRANRE
jgi:hypothetical protein